MYLRPLLLTLLIIHLTSCSTFRPHVNPYKKSDNIFKYCDNNNIEKNAQKYADYLRCEYIDVINDRVSWDRGSGMTIMGALGLAGYRGISGSHSSQIAALTTGSAALYGINQLLVNDPVAAVYAAGLQAVSCVEKSYRQWPALDEELVKTYEKRVSQTTYTIEAKINSCTDVEKEQLQKLKKIKQDLIILKAQDLKVKGDTITELSIINSKVIMEVDNRLPNIESIMALAETRIGIDNLVGNVANYQQIFPEDTENISQGCLTNEEINTYNEISYWLHNQLELQEQAIISFEGCSLNIKSVFTIGAGDNSYTLKEGNKLEIPIFDSSGKLYLAKKIENLNVNFGYIQSEDIYILTIEADDNLNEGTYDLYIRDKDQQRTEHITIVYSNS